MFFAVAGFHLIRFLPSAIKVGEGAASMMLVIYSRMSLPLEDERKDGLSYSASSHWSFAMSRIVWHKPATAGLGHDTGPQ